MRRAEKEIKDRRRIDSIIRRCRVCRLGMADGDTPYVIPICFGYDGQFLYFHSAPQGRKLDILRKNNRVCFEFDIAEDLMEAEDACKWGIRYQSVIGTGTVRIVEDPAGKRQALAAVMAQYSSRTFDFPEHALKGTVVIKASIETLTGKQSAGSTPADER